MSLASHLLTLVDKVSAPRAVHAHCDVPCGVYDPEQARIEAESAYRIIQKYHDSEDEVFRARCIGIKEQRTDIAKHHISTLWSDYFKPEMLDTVPDLHDLVWRALKQCTAVKASVDLDTAQKLLDLVDQIDEAWKKTGGLEKTRLNGRPGS